MDLAIRTKVTHKEHLKLSGMDKITAEDISKLPLKNTSDGIGGCHYNCIILLMYKQFKGCLLVQCLVRPSDEEIAAGPPTHRPLMSSDGSGRKSFSDCYHAHSFLVKPAKKTMIDATNGDNIYESLLSVDRAGYIRRCRVFSRDKVLYWMRKTGQMNVWDEFILKVEYDEGRSDWSFLDKEDFGHPLINQLMK